MVMNSYSNLFALYMMVMDPYSNLFMHYKVVMDSYSNFLDASNKLTIANRAFVNTKFLLPG